MNARGYPVERKKQPVITISIVDDNSGIRANLEQMLNTAEGFRCIGSYRDGAAALRSIPVQTPDVVLMDINMPGMSGIECVRRLKKATPGLKVVMLTVFNDEDHVFASLKAGADGYLLKHSERATLLQSLADILRGGAPVSPQIARSLIEYFHTPKDNAPASNSPDASNNQLTERELEVLDQLAKGASYKEIAADLDISLHTVSNHLRHVYEKLHVHSRAQAVAKHPARSS